MVQRLIVRRFLLALWPLNPSPPGMGFAISSGCKGAVMDKRQMILELENEIKKAQQAFFNREMSANDSLLLIMEIQKSIINLQSELIDDISLKGAA